MSNDTRAECTACGTSLDPYGTEPCPNCGRTDTKKVYKLLVGEVSVSADSGDVRHDPDNRGREAGGGCQGGSVGQRVEEQWNRVQRWFARLQELSNSGRAHERPSDMYIDDVYAFFINCYHLKDWIQHDDSSSLKNAVGDFGRDSVSFQICRDLCLGAKHLHVDDPKSNLKDKKLGRKHFDYDVSSNVIRVTIFVETDAGEKEVLPIAEKCMREWREFLSS